MNNQNNKYSGNFYEEIGDFLGESYLNYGFTKGTLQEVDFLIEHMELRTGDSILDIGCGPGRHSLELARRGIIPTGIDITSSFIELAQKRAAEENLNATFMVADARHVPLSQQFDSAICLCEGAFGLAGDDEGHRQILREIHRLLRPQALFTLTAINVLNVARTNESIDAYTSTSSTKETITNSKGDTKEVDIYTTAFTFRELKLLLEGSGFEVLDGYGCIAGNFSTKRLSVNDIEIMITARRI
ncbi:methyltransferase domain-containing protein [Paenibacillus sp. D2_2]|uniref:class I SAM-dependent methyltransferase n=1 Tax=Paenibacillus sp. D2_2 TaxID=3073092 RepID=UPI0028160D9E|nr:methyltransferase domain-containing protein [Paenibacillus sp. D2_2]WMT41681.1 methyltransferase domain-containing protein [Paenibacillus sp. D2_2]